MARPKADAGGVPARQRIMEAFWAMLAAGPYEDITVRTLASRAGASPNTLYYHFTGIEDVAATALAEEVDQELARVVISLGTGAADVSELVRLGSADREGFMRVRLFAASGSGILTRMLTDRLLHTWLSAAGVNRAALTDDEQRDLTFIFGGVVALLGDGEHTADPADLARLFSRPLGQGVAATMAALSRAS